LQKAKGLQPHTVHAILTHSLKIIGPTVLLVSTTVQYFIHPIITGMKESYIYIYIIYTTVVSKDSFIHSLTHSHTHYTVYCLQSILHTRITRQVVCEGF
jgi:hypothetical protein